MNNEQSIYTIWKLLLISLGFLNSCEWRNPQLHFNFSLTISKFSITTDNKVCYQLVILKKVKICNCVEFKSLNILGWNESLRVNVFIYLLIPYNQFPKACFTPYIFYCTQNMKEEITKNVSNMYKVGHKKELFK